MADGAVGDRHGHVHLVGPQELEDGGGVLFGGAALGVVEGHAVEAGRQAAHPAGGGELPEAGKGQERLALVAGARRRCRG